MDSGTKHTLLKLQQQKADRFMAQADDMVRQSYWDLAANRYYYACFHAVQALFLQYDISAHSHAGVINQFSLHFVKTGLVDVSCGSFLARLFQLRKKADYNCAYDISDDEVREVQWLSHSFVETVNKITHEIG